MLKLLTFRCTRRSEAGAHSDHFLLHINMNDWAKHPVAQNRGVRSKAGRRRLLRHAKHSADHERLDCSGLTREGLARPRDIISSASPES